MGKLISVFVVAFSLFATAQQKIEMDSLKSCRKEFSKKKCLSDEDQDLILFYKDKCPNESGFAENFGCPWEDTDKDGVPDKNDYCPLVIGEISNNGCPWSGPVVTNDCTEFFKKEKEMLNIFKRKISYDTIKLSNLRNIIIDNIPKDIFINSNHAYVSVYYSTFINDDIKNCTSNSTLSHDKMFFIDQQFWTKKILEEISRKLSIDVIPVADNSRKIKPELFEGYDVNSSDYYRFIVSLPIHPQGNYFYIPAVKKKKEVVNPFHSLIKVNFGQYEKENEVTLEIEKSGYNYERRNIKFKYENNSWNVVETKKYL